MIDITKIKIKTKLYYATVEQQYEDYNLKKIAHDTYTFKLDDSQFSPYVKIKRKNYELYLTVDGSLKNWYFSKNDGVNFCKSSIKNLLEILESNLCLYLPKNIYNAKLSVKYDFNLLFDKKIKPFVNYIVEHKELKRRSIIQHNEIIFSNKFRKFKISDDEILGKPDLRDQSLNKLKENTFMLGFKLFDKDETKLFSKKKFDKADYLFDYWDEFVDEFSRVIKDLNIDSYSVEIANYLQNSKINRMRDYTVYRQIKHLGIENFLTTVETNIDRKKALKCKSKFKAIYNKFEALNQFGVKSLLDIKVDEECRRMKK